MEILIVLAVFGYIFYLRNYADLRSGSEKEEERVKEGILLYKETKIQSALAYFNEIIKIRPNSAVSYLYRGRCYKELGDLNMALADLNTGLSYDESLFGLHLEKGKILFGNGNYENALKSLNKAVFNAGEQDAESYYWRALTMQHLNREEEAQKDFEKEAAILKMKKAFSQTEVTKKEPFLDKRLLINTVLVICTSALLVYVIKEAESIHLPYLMAVFTAISIGFVEPNKGWILAVMQCVLLLAGYHLFTVIPESKGRQELENFSLYGSAGLTFAASFLGGFLKRAINQ